MRRPFRTAALAAGVSLILSAPALATPAAWQFRVVDTPAVTPPGELSAVAALSPSDVWAVGDAGGKALAMRYDGVSWAEVPVFAPGDSSTLLGISAVSSSDVWAVGAADRGASHIGLVEHWDGSSWTRVPITAPGDLNDVDFSSPTNGWAVGGGPFLARWDGVSWSATPSPPIEGGEAHQVVALSPTDVWAAGAREVESGGEHDETMLLHWDGAVWSLSDNPVDSRQQEVWAIDAVSPTDIWAVGEQERLDGRQHVLTLHYDGRSWTEIPARNPGTAGQELVGVVAIASNDVWAVGTYDDGVAEHPMAQHWDGTRWRLVRAEDAPGSPAADSLLAVDASSRTNVWAVGLAGPSDAELQPLVERRTQS